MSFAALLAAVYHVAGALGYLPGSRAPMWRHIAFVVIDVAASLYLVYRPIWALPLFAVLTLQQSWSHGSALKGRWENGHDIDWLSLAVLFGLCGSLVMLTLDAKRRLWRTNSR